MTTNEDNIFSYLQSGVDTYATGTVNSAAISNGTITNADLAAGTVTTTEIQNETITADDIATSGVATSEILDGTIVNADVSASAAINGSKLADNEVGAEELDETDNYTWTGAHDFGGATIEVDNQADCSGVTGEGSICWDSDNDVLYAGTGTAAQAVGNPGTPGLTLGTSNAAGSATSVVRTDATIAVFDATVPVTQAFGDSAATGSAAIAARRDHKHGMMASPLPAVAVYSDFTVGTCDGGAPSDREWLTISGISVGASEDVVVFAGLNVTSGTLTRASIDRDTTEKFVMATTGTRVDGVYTEAPGSGSFAYTLEVDCSGSLVAEGSFLVVLVIER